MPRAGAVPARQRGLAGILAMLLAVLIVALAAGVVLRQYGKTAAPAQHAEPGSRGAGAAEAPRADATPRNAVERARALEDSLRKQAEEHGLRIDDAVK